MQKIILTTVFLCLLFTVRSQVIINLQLPPAGLQLKSQLWNMALINSETNAISIKIDMVITDISTGQVVLSGNTGSILLPPGTKQVQVTDVMPVQYNILNTSYNVDANPNGFIPLGTFNVCYSVLKNSHEVVSKIAEECETVTVEPVSPPFLTLPDDLSVLHENRPLFTWLPPAPINLFGSLSYEFKLVELSLNQTASDAIQSNLPVLMSNVTEPLLQYPFSSSPLDTAKVYAWQVKALNNRIAVSNSEIFSFKIENEGVKNDHRYNVYTKLQGMDNIQLAHCNGVLKYEYVNIYNNPVIKLQLTDLTSKANRVIRLKEDSQEVVYGQNFLALDLGSNSELENNHTYLLVVTGAQGEAQAVKFIYNKKED